MTKVVKKQIIVSEDDNFFYGEQYFDDVFYTKYVIPKKTSWVTLPIQNVMKSIFCFENIDFKKCQDVENIIEGDIEELYYIGSLGGSMETLKWVLSNIAVEKKASGKKMSDILPSYMLKTFSDYISSGKIDKTFSKQIFTELVENKNSVVYDVTLEEYVKYGYTSDFYLGVCKKPEHILDDILKQDRYKLVDTSIVDDVVNKVVSTNPDQFNKAKTDPRMVSWLVGQCLKELKGKASPQQVKDKMENIINAI